MMPLSPSYNAIRGECLLMQKPITVVTRDNIRTLRPHQNGSQKIQNKRTVLLDAKELAHIEVLYLI